MSVPESWRDWRKIPPATIAWGATARAVETGRWRSVRPLLDAAKCISCLKCWVQCPDASIVVDEDARVTDVNLFFCKGCGVCAAVCPVGAFSMRPESEFLNATGDTGETGESPGEVGELIG